MKWSGMERNGMDGVERNGIINGCDWVVGLDRIK